MLFTKMKEMSWVKKGVAWTSKETDLSRGLSNEDVVWLDFEGPFAVLDADFVSSLIFDPFGDLAPPPVHAFMRKIF